MHTEIPPACPSCSGTNLFCKPVAANHGYGPKLLEGLGAFLIQAEMLVVICEDCGHMSFFAGPAERKRLRGGSGWMRLVDEP